MKYVYFLIIIAVNTFQFLVAADSIADNDPRLRYFAEYADPEIVKIFENYTDPLEAAVVWDVNGTITGWPNEGDGACALLQEGNFNDPQLFPLLHDIYREMGVAEFLWPQMREATFGQLYKTRFQFLQDPKIPELIRLCPNSFGATKYRSCQYGPIISTHQWRDERLRNLGVHFSYRFSGNYSTPNKDGSFPLDLMRDNMRPPIYYNGLIMVDRHEKGPTVLNLFQKTNFKPKRILIVEDSLKNAKEMIATFEQAGIEGHALIFKGNKENKPFNGPMFSYQLTRLVKENVWVSDADAERMFPPTL